MDLPKIGTPMTGRVVNAAVTPARCAAPPAPQMMTFKPRAMAPEAYSSSPCGSRWAEMTLASETMLNSFNASVAAFMTGQSESLPIRMPTRGELVLLMNVPKDFKVPLREETSNAPPPMQRLHATLSRIQFVPSRVIRGNFPAP